MLRPDSSSAPLPSLPDRSDSAGPPTLLWPWHQLEADRDDAVGTAIDELFADRRTNGRTDALLVVHRGSVVAERYAPGVHGASTLTSWSMAKSMLHAIVGTLVLDGRLDLDSPAAVDAWSDPEDPRHGITLRQLLHFRDGLGWQEDYDDVHGSDVLPMLFGDGRSDTAGFAAARPLAHPPGTRFNYSSGTSNIISRIVADEVGSGPAYEAYLRDRLFDPLGMTSALPKFDDAGTWIASSYCFATARDFARFGELYLRDGWWGDTRLLPEGWVDLARTESGRETPEEGGRIHGMHWWLFGDNPWGAFHCSGYEGQYIICVPTLDLVVVRTGVTPIERRGGLADALARIIRAFDPGA